MAGLQQPPLARSSPSVTASAPLALAQPYPKGIVWKQLEIYYYFSFFHRCLTTSADAHVVIPRPLLKNFAYC